MCSKLKLKPFALLSSTKLMKIHFFQLIIIQRSLAPASGAVFPYAHLQKIAKLMRFSLHKYTVGRKKGTFELFVAR